MAKRGQLQEKICAGLMKKWILAMSWWWNKEQICRDSDLVLSWSKDGPTNNLWINLCGINAKTNSLHPIPFAESFYLLAFHQQSHRSSEMWFVCLVFVSRNLTFVFWFVCRKLERFPSFWASVCCELWKCLCRFWLSRTAFCHNCSCEFSFVIDVTNKDDKINITLGIDWAFGLDWGCCIEFSVRVQLSKTNLFSFATKYTSKISRASSRVLNNFASGMSYFWRWSMKDAQSCTTHSTANFRSCGLRSEVCCLVGRDRRFFEAFQSRLGQTASRQRGRGICSANIGQHTQIDKFTKLFCHFLKNTLLTISCLSHVVLAVYFWVRRREKGKYKSDRGLKSSYWRFLNQSGTPLGVCQWVARPIQRDFIAWGAMFDKRQACHAT